MKLEISKDNVTWKPINKRDALKRISKSWITHTPEKLIDDLICGKRNTINCESYGILRHAPRKTIKGYKQLVHEIFIKHLNRIYGMIEVEEDAAIRKGFQAEADALKKLKLTLNKEFK